MTLEQAIKRNPYDPERGNESAYCRYLRYNVDGWYSLNSKEVYRRWKLGKEKNMVEEYDFTNLWNDIDKTLDALPRAMKR